MPKMLDESGESITVTTKQARGALKSLHWVKRRYTTSKRERNPALYKELTFSWKRKMPNAIFEHKIQKEMTLNFDQTALRFNSSEQIYIYWERGSFCTHRKC